jgi:hypothetical protein
MPVTAKANNGFVSASIEGDAWDSSNDEEIV